MMLARVADSLYWMGRYAERAEHLARLCVVALNVTLDQSETGSEAARLARLAIGDPQPDRPGRPQDRVRVLLLDRDNAGSIVQSLANARENARQVRDQITTETWERLNLLYLRITGPSAPRDFDLDAPGFLEGVIADLHQFRGAADSTMSHGEGWRFMSIGVHLERAQVLARLLRAAFGADGAGPDDHLAMVGLLRMACALEPYLQAYTADMRARDILAFLLFDEDFPRSIRFSTARMEEHLRRLSEGRSATPGDPARLAGRLNARLAFTELEEIEADGAGAILGDVEQTCARLHQAMYETFVAYPLEMRLPA